MFRRYYELTDLQLQLEEFIEPILTINKFYLYYNEIKGIKD